MTWHWMWNSLIGPPIRFTTSSNPADWGEMDFFEVKTGLQARVTFPFSKAELDAALRRAMGLKVPNNGAVMGADGVVHLILGGEHTWCGLAWARWTKEGCVPVPTWVGWNIFEESDVTCLECIADE